MISGMDCSSPCQDYYSPGSHSCSMISNVWHQRISASFWSLPIDILFRPSAPADYSDFWAWPYHYLHCAIGYRLSARYGQLMPSAVVYNPAACYSAKLKVLTLKFSLAGRGVGRFTSLPAPAHSGGRVCVDTSAHCVRDGWHLHPCSDSAGYSSTSVKTEFRLFLVCVQSVSLFSGLRVCCSQAEWVIYVDLLNGDHAVDACAGFMLSSWVATSLHYWVPGG